MIRVAIMGSTGMLGHVVVRELMHDDRFYVRRFCRNPKHGEEPINIAEMLQLNDVDYVINCIGLIKQLTVPHRRDWYVVNSIFPWRLAEHCQSIGANLIQISTDCVYTGVKGKYCEFDDHDAVDDYGLSKSLGEPTSAMVLRTSVIGEELTVGPSLLEWAISHRGKHINGYENHYWNGLTTIEYANVCKQIMVNKLFNVGTFHVHSEDVSKNQLLNMFNQTYGLNLDITAIEAPEACDRTLRSIKSLNKKLEIPNLHTMIDVLFTRGRFGSSL